jgi:hypothetical protein
MGQSITQHCTQVSTNSSNLDNKTHYQNIESTDREDSS